MKKVIGMCGKKGVGKNYVAELAAQIFRTHGKGKKEYVGDGHNGHFGLEVTAAPQVELIAFAEPLKEFLITCLGLNRTWTYGSDKDKNNPTTIPWDRMPSFIKERYPTKSGMMTHREVMQVFGTDFMREIWDLNIWVNTVLRRIDNSNADCIIITDTRFPNEIDALKSKGASIWLVDGPQRGDEAVKNDKHASEALTDMKIDYDVVIRNDIDQPHAKLVAQVRKALEV